MARRIGLIQSAMLPAKCNQCKMKYTFGMFPMSAEDDPFRRQNTQHQVKYAMQVHLYSTKQHAVTFGRIVIDNS